MNWMITASGDEFHFDRPQSGFNTFSIHDIASSLAKVNRFTGCTTRPNSVIEHSLLCADIAEQLSLSLHVQLALLMHDGQEAYLGDCTSPVKRALGAAWTRLEDPIALQLHKQLGLTETFKANGGVIRHIDLIALATERRDLTAFNPAHNTPWPVLDTPGREIAPADINLCTLQREQMHWSEWRDQFLERYDYLVAALIATNNSYGNGLAQRSK